MQDVLHNRVDEVGALGRTWLEERGASKGVCARQQERQQKRFAHPPGSRPLTPSCQIRLSSYASPSCCPSTHMRCVRSTDAGKLFPAERLETYLACMPHAVHCRLRQLLRHGSKSTRRASGSRRCRLA